MIHVTELPSFANVIGPYYNACKIVFFYNYDMKVILLVSISFFKPYVFVR